MKVLNKQAVIIADVGQTHDGSLGMAHAFIDAVARAGANGIKFQTHIAEAESTPEEGWRVKFSLQDATRMDYWKRTSFTEDQWHGLKKHSAEADLLFLSSPFSFEAVELLIRVGVAAWKVASGEVNNWPMLEMMAATGLPFILSTGMSPLDEIDAAVAKIKSFGNPLTVLQCTTEYPCPPERWGLNMIPFFRQRYACAVGLSDHSGVIYAGMAAATIGVEMIEVHVTLSREMFGADVPASLTTAELKALVEGVRAIETAMHSPVDKDVIAAEKKEIRRLFGKSVVLRQGLPADSVLEERHLTLKKPGTGIPPRKMRDLIGRRLNRDVMANTILSEEDID